MKRIITVLLLLSVLSKLTAQVNFQTGSAVFSLPVFNWQDDKSRLNSVVALSYNSGSGLKVNDVASNVGQGWNLVAGGVITRMQVGEPDDQPAYGSDDGNDQNLKKYPAGYLYTSVPVTQGCPISLTQYPIYGAKNQVYAQHNSTGADRQLDYFAFQFNGKSGMFVLDAANGIGQSLGDSKIKISFQKGAAPTTYDVTGTRTTITSFTLKDIDGLAYIFSILGKTKILHSNYCENNLKPRTQPTFKGSNAYYQSDYDDGNIGNPFIINSWYLSEVDDPLTGRKITFSYTSARNNNSSAGADISYYRGSDYTMTFFKTSVSQTPDISSITYPDGHSVSFNYDMTHPRFDLNGEYPLASVDVSYQGRYLSKYLLNTSYFILNRYGTPTSAYQRSIARLCLKSVQKIGVDLKEDTPPYLFDYYTGSNSPDDFVPPPFFYAKDIWGYYNGNNNKSSDNTDIPLNVSVSQLNYTQLKGLCHFSGTSPISLYNAKSGYAQNGLLKQIVYPTGGTLTYQYVQNTGAVDFPASTGSVQTIGGVHVSQTSSTDGGFSNGCGNPVVTQYNYVLNGTTSSLWGIEAPTNTMAIASHYNKDVQGYKLLPPKCKWKYQYPGILSMNDAVDLKGWQNLLVSLGPVLDAVGVVGDVIDVVTLVCYSSGFLAWAAVVMDVIGIITDIITTCDRGNKDNSQNIYYTTNLNDVSPLPTQFKRVEVTESPGTIGKTVYEFTSADDYPVWILKDTNFVNRQRFAPWAYGLPKLITVYDASGNPIKQTKNVYNFSSNNYATLNKVDLNLLSYKCTINKSSSLRSDFWSDPSKYNAVSNYTRISVVATNQDLGVNGYSMYTGRTLLDTTYERVYKQNSSTLYDETATGYYYNIGNYEVSQSFAIQSNGDVIRKYFNYSNNYSSGVYATLASVNNIALPVETITNIYRASDAGDPNSTTAPKGGTPSAVVTDTSGSLSSPQTNASTGGTGLQGSLTHKITEYVQQSNGDIKPSRILEERFTQPGSIVYYNPSSPSSTYKTTQSFTYDANGNLTGLQDEGKHIVTNLYDYNDKYITASVINADPTADKSSYTSFETASFGGWTLTGSGNYNTTSAITGNRSYTLTSGSKLSVSLNTTKSYLLSFWAAGSGITVTGGTLTKSAPTYNGFTYYEYGIAQGTTSVYINGVAAVDELRLYPANARMRTTTYDPLIGKTSECDENNRITYYEYDNLGRLLFVKDENKNALKMYEYNNISAAKQNGCPTTYSNYAISEKFMKSDCGSGKLADSTTFSVAAGTYTSTISQADADAQAENYILINGQAYANAHGSCRLIYYNAALTANNTTQSCSAGYAGGTITYTVIAGTYTSILSQADADRKAAEDTAANAQAYANDPRYAVCTITNAPDWTYYNGDPIKCGQVSGSTHEFVLMKDINPNSSSYNQTQWADIGTPIDACPVGATISGRTSFTYGAPSGGGTISAPPGYTVTVTIGASGSQANSYSLSVSISGVTVTGNTTVNNGSSSNSSTFTFIMPASGTVNYSASFTAPNSAGSGSISVN